MSENISLPIATKNLSNPIREKIEFSLLDAGLVTNQKEAAAAVGIPSSTFNHRRRGRPSKMEASQQRQKLTPEEENALAARCKLGFTPHIWKIREMAFSIAWKRDPQVKIGKCWELNFFRRKSDIKEMLDARLSKRTEEKILHDWFVQYNELVQEYSIKPQNTYCIDEIGIMMGSSASGPTDGLEVMRNPRKNGKLFPGREFQTRELVTVLEIECGDGSTLDPTVIYKSEDHAWNLWLNSACCISGESSTMAIGHSYNGWTDDSMVANIIERHFGQSTPSWEKAAQGNEYRLLLINNHAHLSSSIPELLLEHRVTPYCIPNIRCLQPLDVLVFGHYKNELERRREEADCETRTNKFYEILIASRNHALSLSNIQNDFWNTCLIPIDPTKVLPGAVPLPSLEILPPHERRPLEPFILELQRSCAPLSPKLKREFDDEAPMMIMDLEKNLNLRTTVAKLCNDNQSSRADPKRQETRTQLLEILKKAKEGKNREKTPTPQCHAQGKRAIAVDEHEGGDWLRGMTENAIENSQVKKHDFSIAKRQSVHRAKKQKISLQEDTSIENRIVDEKLQIRNDILDQP